MEEAARASHIAILHSGELKEYGTPFALKETYAKDKLKLIPVKGLDKKLKNYLEEKQLPYQKKEEYFQICVKDSLAAIPVLKEVQSMLEGFEMVQGSMDDVFLNVTGKSLK
jgi:multidrug/hemolysin transport system ATP-binding protein